MMTNQRAEEPQSEILTCIECDEEWDAKNLFVLSLKELSELKGNEQGRNTVFVTPEDLPEFAICVNCQSPDETYFTLAASLIQCRKDNERRNFRFAQRQIVAKAPEDNSLVGTGEASPVYARSQATVTDAEASEFVSCFRCEEQGKNTVVRRWQAKAPGWLGCNILKGRRRQLANPQNPNQRALAYVTSADLFLLGKNGFVACPACMDILIPELQEKARELKLPEADIVKRIRSQSLVAMINGVLSKEKRTSQNS